MKKIILFSFLACLFTMVQAETLDIGWQDLKGKMAPYNNPFAALTADQLYNLSLYARISEIEKAMPDKLTPDMKKQYSEVERKLIEEKIDIEGLISQRAVIMQKRQQAAMATNTDLADRTISMTGFMLAVEFDKGLVSEFLLVPTIGACSHKPVPPANQIVYVSAKEPIVVNSAYMPVEVTGLLNIQQSEKELFMVDGNKNIEMAYSIDNATVTPAVSNH